MTEIPGSRHIFFGRFVGATVRRSGKQKIGRISGFLYDAGNNSYKIGIKYPDREIYVDEGEFFNQFEFSEDTEPYR